jgi:cyclohexadienyl dehydratase
MLQFSKGKLFLMALLFMLFGFTTVQKPPTKSNSILDDVIQRGYLRVGVTADYVPFAFYDSSQGTYKGIDIDLAKQLAKDMEVELRFVNTSRQELTRDILLGKFDVAMSGLPRTMKQTLITNMSTGYFESGKSLLIRQEDKESITNLANADQRNLTVGVKLGGTCQTFTELYFKNAGIRIFESHDEIKQALENGFIDVFLTDNIEAKVIADQEPAFYAVDPYNPLNMEVLAFAFAPGD